MDGSGIGTVVSLYLDYTIVFTLDYSQQMLYWMSGSDNCNNQYTNYIEISSVNGSGRRIVHDISNFCYYRRTQAVDFFGGAVYSYSIQHRNIFKTIMEHVNITSFAYVDNYMSYSSYYMYSGMKVISSKRQLQGICTIIL